MKPFYHAYEFLQEKSEKVFKNRKVEKKCYENFYKIITVSNILAVKNRPLNTIGIQKEIQQTDGENTLLIRFSFYVIIGYDNFSEIIVSAQ